MRAENDGTATSPARGKAGSGECDARAGVWISAASSKPVTSAGTAARRQTVQLSAAPTRAPPDAPSAAARAALASSASRPLANAAAPARAKPKRGSARWTALPTAAATAWRMATRAWPTAPASFSRTRAHARARQNWLPRVARRSGAARRARHRHPLPGHRGRDQATGRAAGDLRVTGHRAKSAAAAGLHHRRQARRPGGGRAARQGGTLRHLVGIVHRDNRHGGSSSWKRLCGVVKGIPIGHQRGDRGSRPLRRTGTPMGSRPRCRSRYSCRSCSDHWRNAV